MPAGILVPDIAVGGYLAGTRPGAHVYSIAHATPLPAVMLVIGYRQAERLVMALALIWLAPSAWTGSWAQVQRPLHAHPFGDHPDVR